MSDKIIIPSTLHPSISSTLFGIRPALCAGFPMSAHTQLYSLLLLVGNVNLWTDEPLGLRNRLFYVKNCSHGELTSQAVGIPRMCASFCSYISTTDPECITEMFLDKQCWLIKWKNNRWIWVWVLRIFGLHISQIILTVTNC